MAKRSQEVTAYIQKQQPFARPILRHLRKLVHESCPDVTEAIKWGMPAFEYKGLFANMAAFKEHATFGFWDDKLLRGERASLGKSKEKAMGSFGRLRSLDDLPSDTSIKALIRKAMKLKDDAARSPGRGNERKPIVVKTPADFLAALKKSPKAKATYDGLAPSHRREYVEWITEAKTDATRQRRLQTAIEWMTEGKRRNWKYEKR